MSELEDDHDSAKENFPQDTERLVNREEGGQDTETDTCDEESSLSPQETRYKSCWRRSFVYISCIIASIGGILFGYDIGIIAGALSQLTTEFCLTDTEKEIVVSSLLLGAFLASLIAGFIIDWIGRRICIIINVVLFIIGAALLTASVVFPMLIIGRLIVGFAVSMSVVAEVAYIAEVSPPKIRGLLISWNELAIVLGFLLAYIVNLAFVTVPFGWRIMFGLSILPAAVQGCLLFFIPKTQCIRIILTS
jgi:MFS family permease